MNEIINKICSTLPEGFEIRLCMENGAAWVTLHNPEGDNIPLPDGDESIIQMLNIAICAANGFIK